MTAIGATSGLDSALLASLRGAQGAADRFADAAARVAKAGTEPPRAPDPIGASPAGPMHLAAQDQPDAAADLVQARIAQRAYEANIAVMRRAVQMERGALDVLG